MHVIKARNVHQALPEACHQLMRVGVQQESRNGPVLRFPEPCTIQYEKPTERVVFWPSRDANPFFHLLESLWMLAGQNDVAFLKDIVGTMELYSDDGVTFNGAYGHRWRHHFDRDQLDIIANALKANPNCRRQVLTMWDGHHDLGLESVDLPCNTQVYFSADTGVLNMTVCNRSNDLIWGALGANAVHFSVLQEYMAARIGVPVGQYWQMSQNMHIYLEKHVALLQEMASYAFPSYLYRGSDPYERGLVKPAPMFAGNMEKFDTDNKMFVESRGVAIGTSDHFIRKFASPILKAVQIFKTSDAPKKYDAAMEEVGRIPINDWGLACIDWLKRKKKAWEEKKDS